MSDLKLSFGAISPPIEQQQARISELEHREAELAAMVERLKAQQFEVATRAVEWVSLSDKKPDVLEVRVKLSDGSEVNCWAQSDGDFYWKGGGSEVFICDHTVTHWMPQPTTGAG